MKEKHIQYDTVVFDLDGTLLDTLNDLANSVNHALEQYHYPKRTLAEIRGFLGNGIERLMRESVPGKLPEEDFQLVFNCFRSHYVAHCLDLTQPYEGIMNLLEQLQEHHIKMAIVSNKLHPAVQELNQRFFSSYISSAVGESATVRRKPNPDAVIAALKELRSCTENAVYVGDSEVDIATAQNAGLPCVTVTWGFRDKEYLQSLQPRFLIDEPLQLLDILGL